MSYWDTSTLVKLYTLESDSTLFENYAQSTPAKLVTSGIALYEASATFRRKESEGVLQPGYAEQLYAQLLQDVAAGELRLLELDGDVEREYGQVLGACYRQAPAISLRTLDALHLAAARVAGETELVATDKRMRDAARLLGFTLFPV
jgi:predicted nucleic acid-binding protein